MKRLFTLFAAFASLALAIFVAFGWVVSLEANNAGIADRGDIESLGNLGEFLNVRYGVPLAIIAGLLGAFVTYTLDRISTRQGETDILEFAERKSRDIGEKFAPLTQSAIASVVFGNRIWSLFIAARLSAAEAAGTGKPLDYKYVRQTFLETCGEDLELFKAATQNLAISAPQIWADPYAALVATEGLAHRPRFKSHLRRMAELMTAFGTDTSQFERTWLTAGDPRETANFLSALERNLRAERAFAVLHLLPPSALPMEYAGLLLHGRVHKLVEPVKTASGGRIESITYNTGAAMLLSIIDSLPRRNEVADLIDTLMQSRSRIAKEFLTRAGPDWSSYAPSTRWMDGFARYERSDCFVAVRVRYGETIRAEYYDATNHAALGKENPR